MEFDGSIVFDGPGSEMPRSLFLYTLHYLEGTVGALAMLLFFISAIVVAIVGLFRVGANRTAYSAILLALGTIVGIVSGHMQLLSPTVTLLLVGLLISSAILFPICTAVVFWRKRLRRLAIVTVTLVMLGFGSFTLRALVSSSCSDYEGACVGESEGCGTQ